MEEKATHFDVHIPYNKQIDRCTRYNSQQRIALHTVWRDQSVSIIYKQDYRPKTSFSLSPRFSPLIVILVPGVPSLGEIPLTVGQLSARDIEYSTNAALVYSVNAWTTPTFLLMHTYRVYSY